MEKITSGQVVMKPRWYFLAGSILSVISLVGITVSAVFLTNLMFFLLRSHGPMGQWRLATILNSFSWWIPVLALLGITISVWLLKQYDFSYKHNWVLVVLGFIIAIVLAALAIDHLGVNEIWSQRGAGRRFYQRLESGEFNGGRFRRQK